MQDMYRQTLAASWLCGKGTLAADQCIEDIFNGGDGWGNKPAPVTLNPALSTAPGADDSEDEGMGTATPQNQHQRRQHQHHHQHGHRSSGEPSRNGSGASKKQTHAGKKARQEGEMPGLTTTVDKKGHPIGGIRKASQRALMENKDQVQSSSSSSDGGSLRGRNKARHTDEVAEWDARDDLRAWTVPSVSIENETES